MYEEIENPKERKSDRILVLEIVPGKKALESSTGLVDTKLFTGENKLHVVMEPMTCLWYFKYEYGILPNPLKVKFTSFDRAYKHAVHYLSKRNIRIKEVID